LDLPKFAGKPSPDTYEDLARTYTNWLKDGNMFSPVGPVSVEDEMQRSAYRVFSTMQGIKFERIKPKTAELYKFKSGPMEEVLSEIDRFWTLEEDYKKLGLLHNRGILMYGPPGSGKTSIINQVVEMITKRGDIVLYSNDLSALREGLKAFRSVEPKRKLVVVLEDADDHLKYDEQTFLHLLDGQDSTDGILYLASTNYIERFPERALRSGRFDKKVFVPQPPYEGRLVFFQNKLKKHDMASDSEIENLADETEGLSFGDLTELVTAVYALKEPLDDVLARLKKGCDPEDNEGENPLKMIEKMISVRSDVLDEKKVYRSGSSLGSNLDFDALKKALGQ
jgi:SpoVK/Ycf46/Vps4 family AAA+-type ATPase